MTIPTSQGVYELYTAVLDVIRAGAIVPAGGVVSFNVAPRDGSKSWLVAYVVGTLSSGQSESAATGAQLQLFTDNAGWPNLWDLCTVGLGSGVVGYYSPPRRLAPSQQLVAQFVGANEGDYAQIRCEYLYLDG